MPDVFPATIFSVFLLWFTIDLSFYIYDQKVNIAAPLSLLISSAVSNILIIIWSERWNTKAMISKCLTSESKYLKDVFELTQIRRISSFKSLAAITFCLFVSIILVILRVYLKLDKWVFYVGICGFCFSFLFYILTIVNILKMIEFGKDKEEFVWDDEVFFDSIDKVLTKNSMEFEIEKEFLKWSTNHTYEKIKKIIDKIYNQVNSEK